MKRAHHIDDARLFDCYIAERQGESPDPPTAEHLADCRDCSGRFDDLARFMDGLRTEADAEADAVFTPDRLRAQHQQIARRVEAVARPARVISFPGRVVRGTISASTNRTAHRWAAAAAAAGLFLGIALGASYEWESHGRGSPRGMNAYSAQPSRLLRPAPLQPRVDASDTADEVFLSELELALERPRTPELAAFDAFTPHVREVRDAR